MEYYEWNRVCDSGVRTLENTGIIALGHNQMLNPIENIKKDINVTFTSCIPYFYGYLLICPGLLVYINIENKASENKLDLTLIDGAFCNNTVVLGTRDGKILYGKEPLKFQEYSRHMNNIRRINECNGKFVLCGDKQISILWEDNNKFNYTTVVTDYSYINAYLYRDKLFAYSEDGYLNIYFVDDKMNIDKVNFYRVNIQDTIHDVKVNNMFVEYNRTFDIYFLCDDGFMALIPDFKYTKDTIKDIGNNLLMYSAKLTSSSSFKDMMKYNDTYIIVGYGMEGNSCVKTTMLKDSIINHNILSNVTGPARYVYNFCSSYENTYLDTHEDLHDLVLISHMKLPVYEDTDKVGGLYIKYSDIKTHYKFDIVDIENVIDLSWMNDTIPEKIYVARPGLCDVTLKIFVNGGFTS